MNLGQMIDKVREMTKKPMDWDLASQLLSESSQPDWAIRDETTRTELEDLVVLSAVAKYYEETEGTQSVQAKIAQDEFARALSANDGSIKK